MAVTRNLLLKLTNKIFKQLENHLKMPLKAPSQKVLENNYFYFKLNSFLIQIIIYYIWQLPFIGKWKRKKQIDVALEKFAMKFVLFN